MKQKLKNPKKFEYGSLSIVITPRLNVKRRIIGYSENKHPIYEYKLLDFRRITKKEILYCFNEQKNEFNDTFMNKEVL